MWWEQWRSSLVTTRSDLWQHWPASRRRAGGGRHHEASGREFCFRRMTLADDVAGVVDLACVDELRRNSGAETAGRVQLLRVSETSGVETHTHHAVSHVQSWLSGGSWCRAACGKFTPSRQHARSVIFP